MIHETSVRGERHGSPTFRSRLASSVGARTVPDAASGARHCFGAVRVIAQDDFDAEPTGGGSPGPAPAPTQPGPTPAPTPTPTPAPPAVPLAVTVPGHIRGASSPAGAPDRIPPRVDTEVAIGVTGAQPSAPVTLSIEGAGGGNGTVTIDRQATVDLSTDATVKLRGDAQTDAGKAGNLRLVAMQGAAPLARSEPFSVAAYPVEVGMSFYSLLQPLVRSEGRFWGARYTLTVASDSAVKGDLDRTKISENVLVQSASGVFKGAVNEHSGFLRTTATQRDNHAAGMEDAAAMIAEIKKEGVDKSRQVSHQFFRFSCDRSGVAEDKDKGAKVQTSGYRITQRTSKSGSTFFLPVKKEGFANNGVAAGTVDDPKEQAAEIKD